MINLIIGFLIGSVVGALIMVSKTRPRIPAEVPINPPKTQNTANLFHLFSRSDEVEWLIEEQKKRQARQEAGV